MYHRVFLALRLWPCCGLSSLITPSVFKAIMLLQLLGWVFLPVYIAGGVSKRSISPTYHRLEPVLVVGHLCCEWLIARTRLFCKARVGIYECYLTVEPPVATTSDKCLLPQWSVFQNAKCFQVKSLYLEPLLSDQSSCKQSQPLSRLKVWSFFCFWSPVSNHLTNDRV